MKHKYNFYTCMYRVNLFILKKILKQKTFLYTFVQGSAVYLNKIKESKIYTDTNLIKYTKYKIWRKKIYTPL